MLRVKIPENSIISALFRRQCFWIMENISPFGKTLFYISWILQCKGLFLGSPFFSGKGFDLIFNLETLVFRLQMSREFQPRAVFETLFFDLESVEIWFEYNNSQPLFAESTFQKYKCVFCFVFHWIGLIFNYWDKFQESALAVSTIFEQLCKQLITGTVKTNFFQCGKN